ncbi:MAG: M48 family metallopeptidase [Candidatus Hydrogenedentes bacterium]|nr:M48 family metallopeptidase [Candidatus Hydrogenedentota bacterium]
MFELIRANKRRSVMLMFFMLLLLLAVGFCIGFALFPVTEPISMGNTLLYLPWGGLIGMGIAFLIWGAQAMAAYFSGDRLLMAAAGAREIEKKDHPRLFNVVEEMTIAAQLPKPPRVYIIENMTLNAFAAGRDPNHAAVAVTAGLLTKLNRDQLQGVIAHEIAHISNRDVLFMTMAGIMVGSIIMISETFLRMMFYSSLTGSRRYSSRRSSNNNDGAAKIVLLVIALVLAVVAPLLAQMLYFACSRQREYLADAGGAVYTRYPEGLASALEVIAGNPGDKKSTSKALAPMYIMNPMESGARSLSAFTSTHPPIEERVRILRSMGGGASYADYALAWNKTDGPGKARIPASALAAEKSQSKQTARGAGALGSMIGPVAAMAAQAGGGAVAAAASKIPEATSRQRERDTGDLLRRMNNFKFINCDCGIRIKLPPEYKKNKVKCVRCGKIHAVK